ncbi:MAG: hypothetical protein N4J56_006731 [Chroococcidiopsis sp. SAG 2025]|nr:hypothetical protein [Chroococcidiopsis sp. SAG 2025]
MRVLAVLALVTKRERPMHSVSQIFSAIDPVAPDAFRVKLD